MTTRSVGVDSEGRGQANVLGFILLFGLVLAVALTIVVVGATQLDDAREASQTEDAAVTFSEFQSQAAELSPDGESTYHLSFADSTGGSAGGAPGASVQGGVEGNPSVDPAAGHIEITGPGGTIVDRNLGTIEYVRGDQKLAYQGGGVFRGNTEGEEAVVESPPPFDYQFQSGEPTLSIPIRTLSTDTGDPISGPSYRLEASTSARQFPSGPGQSNPLESGQTITIRVQSDYYLAWGDLFEERTNADPVYDHPNDVVEVTLDAETEVPDVRGAFSGTPSSGNVLNFAHKVDFSTYHSTGTPSGTATTFVRGAFDASSGANAGQGTIEGDLIVENWADVEASSGSDPFEVTGDTIVGGESGQTSEFNSKGGIDGDLHVTENLAMAGQGGDDFIVGGSVYVDGDVTSLDRVTINGDLHVDGHLTASPADVTVDGDVIVSETAPGWSTDGSDPEAPETPTFPPNDPVSLEIDNRGEDWVDHNDNPGDGTIDDIEDDGGCSSTCTLTTGDYYVGDSIELDTGETLEFDTSGGPIEIYVDDGIDFEGGIIEVNGDNGVRVFNNGDFDFHSGDIQTSPHSNHAPAFWLYMHPDGDITFEDSGFVGVVYAPGDGSGELTMTQHVTVRGAIVAQMESNIDKHTEIEFDEALLGVNPDPGGLAGQTVGYVQISTTDIRVSAD